MRCTPAAMLSSTSTRRLSAQFFVMASTTARTCSGDSGSPGTMSAPFGLSFLRLRFIPCLTRCQSIVLVVLRVGRWTFLPFTSLMACFNACLMITGWASVRFRLIIPAYCRSLMRLLSLAFSAALTTSACSAWRGVISGSSSWFLTSRWGTKPALRLETPFAIAASIISVFWILPFLSAVSSSLTERLRDCATTVEVPSEWWSIIWKG